MSTDFSLPGRERGKLGGEGRGGEKKSEILREGRRERGEGGWEEGEKKREENGIMAKMIYLRHSPIHMYLCT